MNETDLLIAALRLKSDSERQALLEFECAGNPARLARLTDLVAQEMARGESATDMSDAELQRGVEALLANHDLLNETIDSRPGDEQNVDANATFELSDSEAASEGEFTSDFVTSDDEKDVVIANRFVLKNKIGEGGMGEVWLARQIKPIKRNVALKLIKKGMDSKAVLNRFEQERQALAMMDHPNIARVFDGGMTEQGQPFFAMELVSGQPLIDFADREKLNTEERLGLFVLICNAVQHAHQKGIVHRDLKPDNILVTMVDGKPVPKVIDFGVAKATGGRLTDQSMGTQIGVIIGTLEYMAPEQAGYAGSDIDTRADIYSLGVVLYELLTGLRPIDRTRLKEAGVAEMIRVIKEDEPSKPSTRLSTSESLPSLAAIRGIDPKKLTALLKGELDWVVMKCLEKQRERRYETANSLARDIQRYLSNEVVEARPPSKRYQFRKFVSKNKGQVISVGLVMLALLIGAIAAMLGLWEAQRQTGLANLATEAKDQSLQKQEQLAEQERLARLSAEAMTQHALDANNSMVFDIQTELAPKPSMQSLRIKLLKKAREGLTEILQQSRQVGTPDMTIISTHYQLGELEWNLGDIQAARKEFEAGLELARELASTQPENTMAQKHLSNGYTKVGDAAQLLGDTEEAVRNFRRSQEINKALLAANPNDLVTQRNLGIDFDKIGDVALRQGDIEKAMEFYQQAFEIRTKLANVDTTHVQHQRDLASTHVRLGDASVDLGNIKDAQTQYKTALFISKNLAALHPGNLLAQRDFGLNSSRNGNMLRRLGKFDEALEFYRTSLNALKPLVDADPQNAEVKRDLGGIYERLGDTALGLEDKESALEYYKQGLATSQELAKLVIGSSDAQRDLSINNEKLGDVSMEFGKTANALEYYKTALEISERLAVADPKNIQAQSDVGFGYLKLGQVMSMQANFEEAIKYQQRALELRAKLATDNPTNADVQSEFYRSQILVGEARLGNADFTGALKNFKSAKVLLDSILEKGWFAEPGEQLGSSSVAENKKQLDNNIWLCENASWAISDLEFVMAQNAERLPRIMHARVKGLMKADKSKEAMESAGRFVAWIDEQETDDAANRYQAGCLFALAAANEDGLEKAVEQSVAQFEIAREKGYFQETGITQLNEDSDLVTIRTRPEFLSWLESIKPKTENSSPK